MPKNVQMPDGSVIAFPDSMDDATIHAEGLKYLQQVMQPPPAHLDTRAAAAIKPIGPTGGPSGYLFGNPHSEEELRNNIVGMGRVVLPPLGAAAASVAATPYTGGLGTAAAGAGAYTAIDALLKQLQSGKTTSIGSDLSDSAKDAVINEVGGRLIGGVLKTGKAFVNTGVPDPGSILNLKPTASQAFASTGDYPIITNVLKFLEDHFASGSKAAAQSTSAELGSEAGFKLAGKVAGRSASTVQDPNTMVKLITGELVPEESVGLQKGLQYSKPPFTAPQVVQTAEQGAAAIPGAYELVPGVIKKTPFATDPASLDAIIKDPERLQTALTKSQAAGLGYNVRQDMAGYQLARIQQEATTQLADGTLQLDANKMAAAFNDPEMAASNKILFKGSKNVSDIQQFYKNLAATQDKPGTSRILRYANTIGIPMSLMHSAISGNVAGAAVSGGFVAMELSAAALAKALTNPQSGRLMLALANKDALGVSEQYAARMLMKAISGTTVNLVGEDGSKVTSKVGSGGELKTVGQ
jgi:hypothetical protein